MGQVPVKINYLLFNQEKPGLNQQPYICDWMLWTTELYTPEYAKYKSLRRFRQMEEMFAVILHYTQQEICVVVQAVGRI